MGCGSSRQKYELLEALKQFHEIYSVPEKFRIPEKQFSVLRNEFLSMLSDQDQKTVTVGHVVRVFNLPNKETARALFSLFATESASGALELDLNSFLISIWISCPVVENRFFYSLALPFGVEDARTSGPIFAQYRRLRQKAAGTYVVSAEDLEIHVPSDEEEEEEADRPRGGAAAAAAAARRSELAGRLEFCDDGPVKAELQRFAGTHATMFYGVFQLREQMRQKIGGATFWEKDGRRLAKLDRSSKEDSSGRRPMEVYSDWRLRLLVRAAHRRGGGEGGEAGGAEGLAFVEAAAAAARGGAPAADGGAGAAGFPLGSPSGRPAAVGGGAEGAGGRWASNGVGGGGSGGHNGSALVTPTKGGGGGGGGGGGAEAEGAKGGAVAAPVGAAGVLPSPGRDGRGLAVLGRRGEMLVAGRADEEVDTRVRDARYDPRERRRRRRGTAIERAAEIEQKQGQRHSETHPTFSTKSSKKGNRTSTVEKRGPGIDVRVLGDPGREQPPPPRLTLGLLGGRRSTGGVLHTSAEQREAVARRGSLLHPGPPLLPAAPPASGSSSAAARSRAGSAVIQMNHGTAADPSSSAAAKANRGKHTGVPPSRRSSVRAGEAPVRVINVRRGRPAFARGGKDAQQSKYRP